MARVWVREWGDGDLELLRRLNAPELTELVGGPETEEQVLDRHRRYLEGRAGAVMFAVEADDAPEPVGGIGYWPTEEDGEAVYETGWSILGEYHGRGYATAATRLVIAHAREHGTLRHLHAYPQPANTASNAICARTGFTLVGTRPFPARGGGEITVNNWRLDLRA